MLLLPWLSKQSGVLVPSPLPIMSLHIYKASAGSGKTFLLTLEYLKLLLEQPQKFKQILAVTFTNKATAEMKERILEVLEALATGHTKGSAGAYQQLLLQQLPQFTADALQQQAAQAYSNLLHQYSRFAVHTIDAFVQRLVRSFAWEVGLDGGFALQLQTEPVLKDLVVQLYEQLNHQPTLRHWVVQMARQRLENGQRWSFDDDLVKLGSMLFKENYQRFEQALVHLTEAELETAFTQLKQAVQNCITALEEPWTQTGHDAVQMIEAHGLSKNDFHYGGSGFVNYFYKAAHGQVEMPGGRVREALAPNAKWAGSKANAAAKASVETLQPALLPLLDKLVNLYSQQAPDYFAAKAIQKNLDYLRIIRFFSEALQHYRAKNNVLLISDTHLLLHQLTTQTTAAFIYEKMGSRYQHFVIDEFQDTSRMQWDNFKPLIENSLAEGHYNLIVGDVKQAIYRWRNGDWRLLMQQVQEQLNAYKPQQHSLVDNYRSSIPVIEFNNFLFFAAPRVLQQLLNAEIEQANPAASQWLARQGYLHIFEEAYADSAQQAPESASIHGLVQITWVANTAADEEAEEALEPYEQDKEDAAAARNNEPILNLVLNKIQELLADGFAPADIGILTRTNAEARQVVAYLLEAQQALPVSQQFAVISADALYLKANTGVQLLLATLQYLANPGQKIYLAQIKHLLAVLKGTPAPLLEVYDGSMAPLHLPPHYEKQLASLAVLPLPELVHQAIMLYQLHQQPAHSAYLQAFTDVVLQRSARGKTSITEFLEFWEEEGHILALPAASSHAVEVLTIHKSKGLAYTILLMPFLSWNLKPDGKNNLLWVNTHHTPFTQLPILPVNYSKTLAQSQFAAAYFEEQVLTAMDSLNMLYVAFTRARRRIYGWAPAINQKEDKKQLSIGNIAQLLWHIANQGGLSSPHLADTRQDMDTGQGIWTYGADTPVPPKPTPPLHTPPPAT